MGIFSKKYATVSKKKKAEEKEKENQKKANLSKKKAKNNKGKNIWKRCPDCEEIIYKKEIHSGFKTCPKCNHYFKMSASERIELLIDDGTFEEIDANIESKNLMDFPGYEDKLERAKKKSGLKDAVVTGTGKLNNIDIVIGVMDFSFMGGSMGSVVGEKLTRAIELGLETKKPVVIVSTSGGARMHESIISLMQMAKTSAALERLHNANIPFISIPVNPTTGGVTASFAMLGDVIISEPKALIAFAGPRVIKQTIKQKLPEGFQRSEFLLENGMVDIISKRDKLKDTVGTVLDNLCFKGSE